MTVLKPFSMEDVGRRIDHLSDLQELWGWGLAALTAGTYHTDSEMAQAKELEIALKLLEQHMLIGFDPTKYAQVINNLPEKAEEIPNEDREHNGVNRKRS